MRSPCISCSRCSCAKVCRSKKSSKSKVTSAALCFIFMRFSNSQHLYPESVDQHFLDARTNFRSLAPDINSAPAKLATRWPKTPNLVCSTLCSWRTKCPTAASQPEICKTTLTSWLSARKPKAGRAAIQEKATQIHRTARTEDQIDSAASSNTCCMSPSASSAELPPRKINGRYAGGNCRIADDCACTQRSVCK